MSDKAIVPRNQGGDLEVLPEKDVKVKRPSMYRVILLNDDYTPQEFVVWVLSHVFHKSIAESSQIMLDAHNNGRSTIGVYTYDVARTKIMQVVQLAQDNEHPLECIMEPEADAAE